MAGLNKMSPRLDWFSAVSYYALGVADRLPSRASSSACPRVRAASVVKPWDGTIILPGAHDVGPDNLTFALLEEQP